MGESAVAISAGRRAGLFLLPLCICSRWEVTAMMEQFVTFGDLMQLGEALISLATLIVLVYYNHKNSKHQSEEKKK